MKSPYRLVGICIYSNYTCSYAQAQFRTVRFLEYRIAINDILPEFVESKYAESSNNAFPVWNE